MEEVELERTVRSFWQGRQDYENIQSLQKKKVLGLTGRRPIEIWGLEFDPVITLGLRAKADLDVRPSRSRNLKIVQTDRGGQATLHSPGQLVIFPMIDLKVHKIGVQAFVEALFRVTEASLKRHDIECRSQTSDPGVYTKKGKIAFCGLKIDSGVVRHGISINISNDLSLFDSLVPCGNPSLSIDRLVDHLPLKPLSSFSLESFFQEWVECFQSDWKKWGFC